LRNSDGETVLSACKREDFSVDPLMAEAMGVQWALQLALDQGINSVSIHSDAANMVNCINRKSSFAAINLIAEDCRNLMNCLTSVCVVFVSRSQNYVAHNLASLARIMGNRTWLADVFQFSVSSGYAAVSAVPCNLNSCVPACF
jgi:hypothetical protein